MRIPSKIFLLLPICFILFIASGCGSRSQANMPERDASRPMLTVSTLTNPNVIDYGTNWLTTFTEDMNDVNLDFVLLPSDPTEALTKYTLMVTSGQRLPDILVAPLPDSLVSQYARAGLLTDLTQYINDPGVCPNFNNLPAEEKDFIIQNMIMPDGNIYAIPSFSRKSWNESPYRFWVNSEWLDALDIAMPASTEEFYQTLKAFVGGDPNGNGRQDEIGLVGSTSGFGWGNDPIPFIMNAFIYANPDRNYLNVENGRVFAAFTTTEWLGGLTYMNRLYAEGLFAPETFTQDITQLKGIAGQETAIAGVVASGSQSNLGDGDIINRMILMPPLTGPNGHKSAPYSPSVPVGTWFVSSTCQNPALAARVGDFFFEPEVAFMTSNGPEGVFWTRDMEAREMYVDYQGNTPVFAHIEGMPALWGQPNNYIWQSGLPTYETGAFFEGGAPFMRLADFETNPTIPLDEQHRQQYASVYPAETVGKLFYTSEEMDAIATVMTDVMSHVDSMTASFIAGIRSLSEFDAFIGELENMGLQAWLEASQAAYDRAG